MDGELELNEEEVLAYLEHYGVRGMRWGVRNARSGYRQGVAKIAKERKEAKRATKKPAAKRTPEERKLVRARRLGLALDIAAVAATGALLVTSIMSRRGTKKMSSLPKIPSQGTKNLINSIGGIPMHEVRTGFSVGSSGVATPIIRKVVGR